MTAKKLAKEVMGRGYKSFSLKQAMWFELIAVDQQDEIEINFLNGRTIYNWRDGNTLFHVSISQDGRSRISTVEDIDVNSSIA